VAASRGAYASDDLQVDCPELERERVAEIESRARASLLLTPFAERVAITCEGEHAIVEASAGTARASVRAPTSPATVVDDVLAGVDQALEVLRASRTAPNGSEPAPALPRASVSRPPTTSPRPSPAREEVSPPVARGSSSPTRNFTLVAAAGGLEAWSRRAAGGLVVAARRGHAPFWLGLSGSVFRPVSQDSRFDVTELSLAVTVTLQPAFAHGVCLTLRGGPSWLWTVPDRALALHSHTVGAAFASGAELSWPIWRGRNGVMPGFGVRWFSAERGVRLDQHERFALRGLAPYVSLAVVRRID